MLGDKRKLPKLLFIVTGLPWPLDCGHNIRVFENLKALSKIFRVTVVSMTETKNVAEHLAALNQHLPMITFVEPVYHPIHINQRPLLLLKAFGLGFFKNLPYKVSKFISRDMVKTLKSQVSREDFDVVYTYISGAYYIPFLRKWARKNFYFVLEEMDVVFKLIKDYADNQPYGMRKAISHIEFLKTYKYEKAICEKADLILTISEEDSQTLARIINSNSKIFTIPPCIERNPHSFIPVKKKKKNTRTAVLTFVGPLYWPPNAEGIKWFVEEVWPILRAEKPEITLQVVGAGQDALWKKFFSTKPGIKALGYVKDLNTVYQKTDVFIAPFKTGGGVRLKILDAMKAGIPVVTTKVGSKGLKVNSGEHVLIADKAFDFAKAIIAVLDNKSFSERLVKNSLFYVKQNHSREAVYREMKKAFDFLSLKSKEEKQGWVA
jgi:glycosyltransferase involved in cell wall biosynthesis